MNNITLLISYAKFGLNSLRNNEITIKLLITDILSCSDPEMMSYLNNGYDIMNCFAKFKKFLPHNRIIIHGS